VGDADDETPKARAIAQHLGLPFETLSISGGDLLHSAGSFGALLDEPNGDRSCVPTYLLSRLIRSHVTVAVSGDGGDELFAGYGRYLAAQRDSAFQALPPSRQAEQYFFGALPVFARGTLEAAMPEQMILFRRRFVSRFQPLFTRPELDTFARLRTADAYSYLPGAVLAKVDRMAMKHSLEVRTPFFSPEVLALSSRLPARLVHANGLLKLALRRVLERYLPSELLKVKKQGFGMPARSSSRTPHCSSAWPRAPTSACVSGRLWLTAPRPLPRCENGARANINSLWAWIVLGQWVESLSLHKAQAAELPRRVAA
ncbi:MAG: asparagine synthase, partial [Aquincola sp.]|nr:asparagine synthase [Aquincola sp.]